MVSAPRRANPRIWLALGLGAVVVVVAVVALSRGGGHPGLPLPGLGRPARSGDPFGYVSSREGDFVSRAVAGSGNVIFAKSPGGVLATAARVAAYRGLINRAVAGTGIDPNVVEGIVFLESAGRPDVIAGTDLADAAGLTQILAQTGQSLLGMHIDLAASRRITNRIQAAFDAGRANVAVRLLRQRARVDDRFDPLKALEATVRYLRLAEGMLGRPDLAVESYHMGIGNLRQVLADYDGGRPVPYAQLYFDTEPDHHTAAYNLISGFGDDSSLYYWRVLGAMDIMRLYRSDRGRAGQAGRARTRVRLERLCPSGLGPVIRKPQRPLRRLRLEDAPAAALRSRSARPRLQPLDRRRRSERRRAGRALPGPAAGRSRPADRARRPGAVAIRSGAANAGQRRAGPALRARSFRVLSGRQHRLFVPDRPALCAARPGLRVSGHAGPPPGAQPDRLGAHPDHRSTSRSRRMPDA